MDDVLLRDIGDFLRTARRPLLVILGPTASGKTTSSLELARNLRQGGRRVGIVNADSRQLYRYLDIGTAKISRQERGEIPHYLLDVLDPREEATAAWYKEHAEQVIDELHAQGMIPLLVGGSMLYLSAVLDNLQFAAKPDPLLRKRLQEEYHRYGALYLFEKLQRLDPEGALTIDMRNPVYLLRAIEVCVTTQTTLRKAKRKDPCPYDTFIFGLTLPREELHQRIDARTGAMFRSGWVREVSDLLRRGYGPHDPGMKSHGYREIVAALRRHPLHVVEQDSALRESIATSTRQYARRQRTWWRNDQRIRWIKHQYGLP
jgi:tRNA dimethylallyltransferase